MQGKLISDNVLCHKYETPMTADIFHSIIGHKGVLTKTAASLAVVGAGVYLWERHRRHAAQVTINQYASQPGSLEGLDRSSSAMIQMDNSGYDNPQNQDARMRIKRVSATSPSISALKNPTASLISSGYSRDLRGPLMSLDDRLSRML